METLSRLIGALGNTNAPDAASSHGSSATTGAHGAFADTMASLAPSHGGLEAPRHKLNGDDAATPDPQSDAATLAQHAHDAALREEAADDAVSGDASPLIALEPMALLHDASVTASTQSTASKSAPTNATSAQLSAVMERLTLIEQAGTQAAAQQAQQALPATAGTAQQVAPAVLQNAVAAHAANAAPAAAPLAGQGASPANTADAGLLRNPQSALDMPATLASRQAVATPLDTAMARQARGDGASNHSPTTSREPTTPLAALSASTATEQRPAPTMQAVSAALSATQQNPADATAFVPTRGDVDTSRSSDLAAQTALSTHSASTHGSGQSTTLSGNAATPAQASLSAPLGSQDWTQQLGRQLLRFSQGSGEQRIEMRLHPAELGPLSVSLKFGDQGAQAQFLSAHAPVRQALEQAIPQLREALAEQGISLGETSVGEQQQGNADDTGAQFASAAPGLRHEGDEPSVDELAASRQAGVEGALEGRVDLYA